MRKTQAMKHQSTIYAALVAVFVLLHAGAAQAVPLGPLPLETVPLRADPVHAEIFSNPFASTLIRSDQDDARDAVRSGQVISMEQALSVVRSEYPGRLLDADFDRRSGMYNVKILSRGEVVQVAVNAQDGRIVNVQKGSQ